MSGDMTLSHLDKNSLKSKESGIWDISKSFSTVIKGTCTSGALEAEPGAIMVFLPARRYASADNSDRNVSVCPSVRHAPVLCQNEES